MALITFEGKPIEKLIEVVSQGIGKLYVPRSIRKEADAEAYKIIVIETAKAKAKAEKKLIELDQYENIQQRILFQEKRKQDNIDQVIEIAADQINQSNTFSDNKVDDDWTTRFFNIVEDVSAEDMQKLWGRILAGEVKEPGAFSLRTLEVLKNLSREEAQIFTKFANLLIDAKGTHFIPYHDKTGLDTKFNIKYTDILLLTELGLISSGSTLGLIFPPNDVETISLYTNGDVGIHVTTKPGNSERTMSILSFTKTGSQLAKLVKIESNIEYIKFVCEALNNSFATIRIGIVGEIQHDNMTIKNVVMYNDIK